MRGERTAIYLIAITQVRCHPDATAYVDRRVERGNTKTQGLRALPRRLSDIVDRVVLADIRPATTANNLAEAT